MKDNKTQIEPFIGKAEVAKRLGRTIRTVDNYMTAGVLPFYKMSRSVQFRWSEIEAHLLRKCHVLRKSKKVK